MAAAPARGGDRYRKLDRKFHRSIIDHGDNCFLASCYDTIDFRFRALRNRLADRPWINARTLVEHRTLAALVSARHVGKAKALLTKHLRAATSDYNQLLREQSKLQ